MRLSAFYLIAVAPFGAVPLSAGLPGSLPPGAADFMVHEWGTFTSIVGSDGRMLSGLEVEEERVPNFVRSLSGFAPSNKGWDRPVAGVTVKMETPVLYFYSAAPRRVRVDVGFNGGSISQWYPERVTGETLPDPPQVFSFSGAPPPPLDFRRRYRGHASWRVDVLERDSPGTINTPREQETPQWPRARVPGANLVHGVNGEVEGFIFYRGLGNFRLPLAARAAADGALALRNDGGDSLPFVWVYENLGRGEKGRNWCGPLSPGGRQAVPANAVAPEPEEQFQRALVVAGLTPDEAMALRATWRESYFERPGLRVFWIVPRRFTDAVLPMAIHPKPARLERVLVGRTEVLTPAFEAELVRDFADGGGSRWEADRYYRAYRERAAQLGAMLGVAPARRTP